MCSLLQKVQPPPCPFLGTNTTDASRGNYRSAFCCCGRDESFLESHRNGILQCVPLCGCFPSLCTIWDSSIPLRNSSAHPILLLSSSLSCERTFFFRVCFVRFIGTDNRLMVVGWEGGWRTQWKSWRNWQEHVGSYKRVLGMASTARER